MRPPRQQRYVLIFHFHNICSLQELVWYADTPLHHTSAIQIAVVSHRDPCNSPFLRRMERTLYSIVSR